jgi:hypothetical protein
MSFDHIIRTDTEAAAFALLRDYVVEKSWHGDFVNPDLEIITHKAEWDRTDPKKPILVTPEQTLDGFWLAIALPAPSESLRDLPGNACRIIADRDAAGRGKPFLLYVSPAVDPALLMTARMRPAFAGPYYPFRTVQRALADIALV